MYNNEVTYDEKWDTPDNRRALEKLERKYFDKSQCSPDCPVAWAPEVLELMDTLDKELGFLHNEDTIRGYYIQGGLKDWFIVRPVREFFHALRRNIMESPNDYIFYSGTQKREKRKRTIWGRIKAIAKSPFQPMGYGFKALKVKYINPKLNKIQKNKISLGQLKEKYGSLTLYFRTDEVYREYVDKEIRKTTIKLALKGAYYPIENFWDAGIGYGMGTEYNPDVIEVKTMTDRDGKVWYSVDQTVYRSLMKEMGLDLKEIENKAILKKASKADPV